MTGPLPKPTHLRQRRNQLIGAATFPAPLIAQEPALPLPVPELPHPAGGTWHPLTVRWWWGVWHSPVATAYLPTDIDGLARLAVLIDQFYVTLDARLLPEIRLQG